MDKKYKNEIWKEFRKDIIESDGYKCTICKRTSNEAILQVHHKKYIKGRKLWEYASKDCITLCRGCHAIEHGLIMPTMGWEFICDEDLGGLNGICEKCEKNLRYAFHIFHINWGIIQVGRQCCDSLTGTSEASSQIKIVKFFENRKNNFIKSTKWIKSNNLFSIKKNLFDINIEEKEDSFYLSIHGIKSPQKYNSLNEAKSKAFETIEKGKLIEYCIKHNIPLPPKYKANK